MKKVIGYILSGLGILVFLSLYFLTVIFKEYDNIAYIILGVGYIGVIIFIMGIMLLHKKSAN